MLTVMLAFATIPFWYRFGAATTEKKYLWALFQLMAGYLVILVSAGCELNDDRSSGLIIGCWLMIGACSAMFGFARNEPDYSSLPPQE